MKVYLDTVGCRLNQSEIETYARQFVSLGHEMVPGMDEADLMVLNSCAVTAAAASDSRQKIRQAHRAGIEKIVVTGCLSSLRPEAILKMPGVIEVVPNVNKDSLVGDLLQIDFQNYEMEPIARQEIPGSRMRTRAFIKVQDGCDNKCTFCITTVARGEGRSRSPEAVIADIRAAQEAHCQEVVLTGVHLGSWGYDFPQATHLQELIKRILLETDVPRLRISSLEPWDIEEDFFDLWQDSRLCRHLHLPLQAGSAGTLRRMARKIKPAHFQRLVELARLKIPGLAITTDLIAGFPGETEAEFSETKGFVKKMAFSGAHVFTYSARSGTAAASMPAQVHHQLRKERSQELRALCEASALAFQEKFLGIELPILWESAKPQADGSFLMSGLSDNYLRVYAPSSQPLNNQITLTRLTKQIGRGLMGEVLQLPDSIHLNEDA